MVMLDPAKRRSETGRFRKIQKGWRYLTLRVALAAVLRRRLTRHYLTLRSYVR